MVKTQWRNNDTHTFQKYSADDFILTVVIMLSKSAVTVTAGIFSAKRTHEMYRYFYNIIATHVVSVYRYGIPYEVSRLRDYDDRLTGW